MFALLGLAAQPCGDGVHRDLLSCPHEGAGRQQVGHDGDPREVGADALAPRVQEAHQRRTQVAHQRRRDQERHHSLPARRFPHRRLNQQQRRAVPTLAHEDEKEEARHRHPEGLGQQAHEEQRHRQDGADHAYEARGPPIALAPLAAEDVACHRGQHPADGHHQGVPARVGVVRVPLQASPRVPDRQERAEAVRGQHLRRAGENEHARDPRLVQDLVHHGGDMGRRRPLGPVRLVHGAIHHHGGHYPEDAGDEQRPPPAHHLREEDREGGAA
mmetsp:Transcript_62266/g.190216  ORF Transcript_62266/g.190216 Transcript_62266/m.190216 type:complete len:272 (+) Transcript_62266:109-924(+)